MDFGWVIKHSDVDFHEKKKPKFCVFYVLRIRWNGVGGPPVDNLSDMNLLFKKMLSLL